MTSNIPIENIFYMLAYVFEDLKLEGNESSSFEEFENVSELYAEILYLSFFRILKQGIYKEYTTVGEDSSVLRGKLDLNETIKRNLFMEHKVHVNYDELSENNLLNQIIKTTLIKLINNHSIQLEQKNNLRSLIIYLGSVDEIDLKEVRWDDILWNRQNVFYRLPIYVCYYYHEQLIIKEADQSDDGVINDKQLHAVFERFVRRFYEKETNYDVSSPHIQWDEDNDSIEFLPRMETDMVLKREHKTVIIDTKFYEKNISDYENHLSNNLYQIFSYIKNYQQEENLGGMLLYARTESDSLTNQIYNIQGHPMAVTTINLGQNFNRIKDDLLKLANDMFESIK